ncbi:hypothetical protein DWS25_18765 [Escherichia coli]|nr:hypothetical protein [Escherichia coli O157:H7]EFO1500075.1 hypothetical protein [Escherichia coli]EKB8112218.1 hypothetical protein [Escherichia coli]ELT2129262.1 hypothetical protein [Escherichia coli]MBC0797820.1 hypothetical protein [Escherichia coli]
MRKDIIAQALPVLGKQIKFKQEMADDYLMRYQLHGNEFYANVAARFQHDANVLAELYNDLSAELDRQPRRVKLLFGPKRKADRQRHQ